MTKTRASVSDRGEVVPETVTETLAWDKGRGRARGRGRYWGRGAAPV